jgi:hypothetical protein
MHSSDGFAGKTAAHRWVIYPASSHTRRSRRQSPGAHALRRPPVCFRDDGVCRLLRQSERKSGSGRFPWGLPARNWNGGRHCVVGVALNNRLKQPAGRSLSARNQVDGNPFHSPCRSTLAESKTSIEELYAWEFDGPFLRDFTGNVPADCKRDAGTIGR